jgi:hypothetical protein
MLGQKCAECGLVNWVDQELCKRCGKTLKTVLPQPSQQPIRSVHTPSFGTFNGIGTRLIGWYHNKDGSAFATVWFTFLYLPIFPINRFGLLSPTKSDFEPPFSFRQLLVAISPISKVTTSYRIVEQLPLSGKEVFHTYLYAYVWVPFKVLVPLWLITKYSPRNAPNEGSMTPLLISGSIMMAWMGYVIVMLTRLLHRSRGG